MEKTIALFIAKNKEMIKSKCEHKILKGNELPIEFLLTKAECIKHLNPNIIVSGVIEDISYDSMKKKKNQIIIRLKTLLAVIISEEDSYQSFLSKPQNIQNLLSYQINGIVPIDEIYDRQLLHLNDIIDSNLIIGNEIITLITCINDEVISLSLRNSLIKGKKQSFIEGNDYLIKIPFNLGMKMDHSSEEKNERYLENKISQYQLKQYGSEYDCKVFHYDTLRKLQNYDWSDEYVSKGDLLAKEGLHFLAIENYEEAEKLDPLNTETYMKKGNACLKVKDYKKAMSSFKNCLKIDSSNKQAREHIEELVKKRIGNTNDMNYLSKKRKHE